MQRYFKASKPEDYASLKRKLKEYLRGDSIAPVSTASTTRASDPTLDSTSEKTTSEKLQHTANTKLSKFKPYFAINGAHKTLHIVQRFHLDDLMGSNDRNNRTLKLSFVDWNEKPYQVYYGLCFQVTPSVITPFHKFVLEKQLQ